jgi:hypothetical protein
MHAKLLYYVLFTFGLFIFSLTAASAQTTLPPQSILKRIFGPDPLTYRTAIELPDEQLLLLGTVEKSSTHNAILLAKCSQTGVIEWAKSYEATGMETPNGVFATSDGGYMIVGNTTSGNLGDTDLMLAKVADDGTFLWSKVYGGNLEDRGFIIVATSDDHLLIGGSTRSYGNGMRDALLLKVDPKDGDLLWSKTYGGSNNDNFFNAKKWSDTQILFTGVTLSYGDGRTDFWLVRIDEQGSLQFGYAYGDSYDEHAGKLSLTPDGEIIIAGHGIFGPSDYYDGMLMKADSSGNLLWVRRYGYSGGDYLRSQRLAVRSDGHIFLGGTTDGAGLGQKDLFLVEMMPNTVIAHARNYGKSGDETSTWTGHDPMLLLSNERLLMPGNSYNQETDQQEILFANLLLPETDACIGTDWSPASNVLLGFNQNTAAPTGIDQELQTASLSFTIADYPLQYGNLSSEFCPIDLVISADDTNCSYQASNDLITSGSVEVDGAISYAAGNRITLRPGFKVTAGNEFSAIMQDCSAPDNLAQPSREVLSPEIAVTVFDKEAGLKLFPNPASDELVLQLELEQPQRAGIGMFNASGKLIRQFVDQQELHSGVNECRLDISGLPSGMYFLRLRVDGQVLVRKVIKL